LIFLKRVADRFLLQKRVMAARSSGDLNRLLDSYDDEGRKGIGNGSGIRTPRGGQQDGTAGKERYGGGYGGNASTKNPPVSSAPQGQAAGSGTEEVMEVTVSTPPRPTVEQPGGVGTGRMQPEKDKGKRTVEDRSPTAQEEMRNIRRRLNEFDVGEVFKRIDDVMRLRVEEVVLKSPSEGRESLREGLGVLTKAVAEVMNCISDGLKQERIDREVREYKFEERLEKLESKTKELDTATDSLTNNRIKLRVRDSIKETEAKVREAQRGLKVMDIDIGKETVDKREIVRITMESIRCQVRETDVRYCNVVLRRTRLVILGKGTSRRDRDGNTTFTVPTLFQCRDRRDMEDLDNMLRGAGYFPTFHWPQEMVEFVSVVRDQVRSQGYPDSGYYIKVRPEEREGKLQIKAEVKGKDANRFILKGVWSCPPLLRALWDSVPDLFKSQLVGRL